MKHLKDNIPEELISEIWDWCRDTFQRSDWFFLENPSQVSKLFSIRFKKESDYILFILKWESVIKDYVNKHRTQITFPGHGFRVGDLVFAGGMASGSIKRVVKTTENIVEIEDA